MKKPQVVAVLVLLLLGLTRLGIPETRPLPVQKAKPAVSSEVRRTAKKLAFAWVETAKAETIDALCRRSIAFAGMVPGLYVKLDGKPMNAGQALIDSALTLIGKNDEGADAGAMRNIVYALMEVAEGRATRGRAK